MGEEQQAYADGMTAFDAYYDTLHELYGREYPSRQYHAHRFWRKFLKVGETCRRNGWDIGQYVRTVIEYSGKPSNEMLPSDLVGPAKEQLFIARRGQTAKRAPEDVWRMRQSDLLRIQVATQQSDVDVLSSPLNTAFPAWFRVFYPEKIDSGILDVYWSDALEEMREDHEIVKFLRATAPSRLADAERRMGVTDGI